MKKPPALKPGDKIAVISPSWGGPYHFPHIFEQGLRVLKEDFGFEIVEYPSARMDSQLLYKNPKLRAQEINQAFGESSIKGIICSIGGDDSIRILEYLDIPLILSNPKLIMGYSDSTTFLTYLNSLGLVTFHGSAVMSGFSQLRNFPEVLQEYKSFFFTSGIQEINPYPAYCQKYPDWGVVSNAGGIGEIIPSPEGHIWLNKGLTTSGKLWGGCIEVLDFMNGTDFWPRKSFWNGKILFIETSEEKPKPDQVGYWLRNFGIQGILGKINGLLVGKPKDYSVEEKESLAEIIHRIVVVEFNRPDLNLVMNLDIGHTDPRHIMPLGLEIEIDPISEKIRLLESPFYELVK